MIDMVINWWFKSHIFTIGPIILSSLFLVFICLLFDLLYTFAIYSSCARKDRKDPSISKFLYISFSFFFPESPSIPWCLLHFSSPSKYISFMFTYVIVCLVLTPCFPVFVCICCIYCTMPSKIRGKEHSTLILYIYWGRGWCHRPIQLSTDPEDIKKTNSTDSRRKRPS